jgi:precorrin-6B methylase 1
MSDITIVGLGVLNVDQVTYETVRAIRRSNEVLFVDTGVATSAFLEKFCPKVTSLYATSYSESGCRLGSYDRMAVAVIEAALDHPPVTFAMGGHPIVGAEAPFLIHEMARLLDLEVVTLPGISAMDCMFSELMIDPCVDGLQMYEATDLLLRRHSLLPAVPALIWQIGVVETRLHTQRRSKPLRFDRFKAHVLQFYPPGHLVTAYFASQHPLMRSQILQFPMGEIGNYAEQLHAGFTLFIPAASVRPILDEDLLSKIDRIEHLDDLTH